MTRSKRDTRRGNAAFCALLVLIVGSILLMYGYTYVITLQWYAS